METRANNGIGLSKPENKKSQQEIKVLSFESSGEAAIKLLGPESM
jgi:hypothetical protein